MPTEYTINGVTATITRDDYAEHPIDDYYGEMAFLDLAYANQIEIDNFRQCVEANGYTNIVYLDALEHSGTVWYRGGEGHPCPWDTQRGRGVLACTGTTTDETINKFIDELNAYECGDVYVIAADANHSRCRKPNQMLMESCGNLIGYDHAEAELLTMAIDLGYAANREAYTDTTHSLREVTERLTQAPVASPQWVRLANQKLDLEAEYFDLAANDLVTPNCVVDHYDLAEAARVDARRRMKPVFKVVVDNSPMPIAA